MKFNINIKFYFTQPPPFVRLHRIRSKGCKVKINKKDQILQTAENLFNRFGTCKTGVEDIAKSAKVAKGTIYNYFGNKQGVIEEILNNKLEQFEESLKLSLNQMKDPWKQIKEVINQRLEIIQSSQFLSDNLFREERINFSELFSKLDKQVSTNINNLLEKIPDFSYEASDKNIIIQTLILSLRGLEDSFFNGQKFPTKDEIETALESLIWTIFRPNFQLST